MLQIINLEGGCRAVDHQAAAHGAGWPVAERAGGRRARSLNPALLTALLGPKVALCGRRNVLSMMDFVIYDFNVQSYICSTV